MRRLIRHITLLLVALLTAFTSVQLAAARGQSPAVGMMEICTGTGPVHILVDENGEPTGGVMICPDYALAFYADPATALPRAGRFDIWKALWLGRNGNFSAEQTAPETQARGPPASV